MKAIYKILANKADISTLLENRLLSMTITDEIGLVSDSITLELDDQEEVFTIPERGAEIEAFLGYDEDELYSMGKFIADEVEIAGLPNKLTITGRASNSAFKTDVGAFKAPKSYSWEEYTLQGIIQTIAKRYKLDASVDESFKAILIKHIDQTDESDAAFIQRLAKDYGAVVKIAGGKLMFTLPARGILPDGSPLPTIPIPLSDLSNYKMRISERGLYNKVIAKYYDFDEAEEKKVEVGNQSPIFSMRDVYTNRTQALMRAKGKLEEIMRGQYELSAEMIGNPLISAESKIEIIGIREELQSSWIVKRATHSLNSNGYKTSIEATRPII